MQLLHTKRSPYARKVRIMALEKNIPLECIDENLTEKSERLLKANPLGKIPVLILDNGKTLCDSPLICEYIDSMNTTPVLIPKDFNKRMDVLNMAAIADGLMDVTIAVYMEKVRHPQDFAPGFVQAQEKTIGQTLKFLDANLDQLKELSLASIAVATAIGYMNFRVPHLGPQATGFTRLARWFEEFSKRPSMQQTIPTL